jgi:predicted transcriptional regulator
LNIDCIQSLLHHSIRNIYAKEKVRVTHVRQISTTEMQVTSIRLEQELKEHLKELAGHQGYQALIREILWDYVNQRSTAQPSQSPHIRATLAATAQSTECCALSGQLIHSGEPMLLGLTTEGSLVPLSANVLNPEPILGSC